VDGFQRSAFWDSEDNVINFEVESFYLDGTQIIWNVILLDERTISEGIGGHHSDTTILFSPRLESISGTAATQEELNKEFKAELGGVHALELDGKYLTRVWGDTTDIPISFFEGAIFREGKTLIYDKRGTCGVYIGDCGNAGIRVKTYATSLKDGDVPILLGTVETRDDLPRNTKSANFATTPHVGDWVRINNDIDNNNRTTVQYIIDINGSGDITWGNGYILNTTDYQEQSSAREAGKVLTSGEADGTFGKYIGFDPAAMPNSLNLIRSGAVHNAVAAVANRTEIPQVKWFRKGFSALGTVAAPAVVFSDNTNIGIEFGRRDGMYGTPYWDFHTGNAQNDFDARIIARQQNGQVAGNTSGTARIEIHAARVEMHASEGVGTNRDGNIWIFRGAWASGMNVIPNDVVFSNGIYFRAKIASSGTTDPIICFQPTHSLRAQQRLRWEPLAPYRMTESNGILNINSGQDNM
jgi:hypothetical protein